MTGKTQAIEDLMVLLEAQCRFTEQLRSAANRMAAHASHVIQNYCGDVPEDKLAALSRAQVDFSEISMTPSPATAVSTVVRAGAAVN